MGAYAGVEVVHNPKDTKKLKQLRDALTDAECLELEEALRISVDNPQIIDKMWMVLSLLLLPPPPKGKREGAHWIEWDMAMLLAKAINDAVREGKPIPAMLMTVIHSIADNGTKRQIIREQLGPHSEPGWDAGLPPQYRS
jgi:hypothetical protein